MPSDIFVVVVISALTLCTGQRMCSALTELVAFVALSIFPPPLILSVLVFTLCFHLKTQEGTGVDIAFKYCMYRSRGEQRSIDVAMDDN